MLALRFFLLIIVLKFSSCAKGPVVKLKHGDLRGSILVSTNGRQYASFRGIPYASPPTNGYRFKDPQPLRGWKGVKNAGAYSQPCLQYAVYAKKVVGNENCLYLNVFTPRLNRNASLPVLVYIHGGMFLYGGSNLYDAANLMDKNIVVVTMNYRLGPLGFLSTGDKIVSGNMGLKDQAYALRWVQDNIKIFGGNPRKVTLMGHASVTYHFLSPLSKGTFSRGIAVSGTAFDPWAFTSNPAERAKSLAHHVDCPATFSETLVKCLKKKSAAEIVSAQTKMFDWTQLFSPFTPSIEDARVKNAFITEHPYAAVWNGDMQKLPLILSNTGQNGLYPAAEFLQDVHILLELDKKWDKLAGDLFLYRDTLDDEQMSVAVAHKIRQKYLDGQPLNLVTFPALVRALTDRLYAVGTGEMAMLHAAFSKRPVYVYNYRFIGNYSLSFILAKSTHPYQIQLGASNGDDTVRIFNSHGLHPTSANDTVMARVLVDMVYNFASTGVPKLSSNFTWIPVNPGSSVLHYLDFSTPNNFTMNLSFDYGERRFWNNLGFIENMHYSNQYDRFKKLMNFPFIP